MRRALAMTGVLLVALGACGSDADKRGATRPETSSSSSSSSTTTTTAVACQAVGGATARVRNEPASEPQYLTDVTTTSDGCVDTITFLFRPSAAPAPGYTVEYADGPFANSAGETVNPGGAAFLKVRFEPAWIADLNQESAPLTYTGPRTISPTGMTSVRGLVLFDASEAVVGWVVGLDAQHPFTVEGTAGRVVIRIGSG